MTVSELIIKLSAIADSSLQVMIDVSTNGSSIFKFVNIDEADEVTTNLGENIVVLHSGSYEEFTDEGDDDEN